MRAFFLFFCKFSALMIPSKRRKLWFRAIKYYIIHPAFMLLHTKLTRNITLNWFLQTTTASFVYPACWTENKHSNSNILYLNTIGFKAQSLWGRVQIKFNKMKVFEERGKPECLGKNLSEQRQTQPTYDTKSGNRTRDTLVGGECIWAFTTYFVIIPSWLRYTLFREIHWSSIDINVVEARKMDGRVSVV